MLYIFRHIKIFSLVSFCLIIDCRLIQCYLRNCFHIVLIYFLLRSSFPNGEGNGTPLQHSCLENPMDGGAWWATVHGVAKSRTRLSDFTFTFMGKIIRQCQLGRLKISLSLKMPFSPSIPPQLTLSNHQKERKSPFAFPCKYCILSFLLQ